MKRQPKRAKEQSQTIRFGPTGRFKSATPIFLLFFAPLREHALESSSARRRAKHASPTAPAGQPHRHHLAHQEAEKELIEPTITSGTGPTNFRKWTFTRSIRFRGRALRSLCSQ